MRFATLAVASIVVAVLHPSCARLVGRRRLDGVAGSPGNPFVNVAPMPPQQDENECPQDPRPCPDGSLVEPDPDNDCEYPDCPVCCDIREIIDSCVFGPPQCCNDGSWTCLVGGKYVCGDFETTNPSGTICGENQEETVINQASCVVETKTCDDGSTVVVRDPDNDCEWFPCPTTEPCCELSTQPDCGDDTPACCEGGTWADCPLVDDGFTYYKCSDMVVFAPSGVVCQEEELVIDQPNCVEATKECPDGSILVPDPDNNCEFPACPCCDPSEFPDCNGEGQAACCGNGEWSCPTIDEGEAFYECSGSDELLPVPLTGIVCEVQDAPQESMPTLPGVPPETTMKQESMSEAATAKCCNPNEEPNKPNNPMCKTGYQCCPNGMWACGVGDDRSFLCRNSPFYTGPFSEACPCCNTFSKPDCNDAMCCEDGTWSCPSNGVYTCGGESTTNPSGVECETDGAPGEPKLPLTTVIPNLTTLIETMVVPTTGAGVTNVIEDSTATTDVIVDESVGEVPASTTGGTTAGPITNEVKPQACSFEKRACRFGPSVGRDPNNNCEFLPCLTRAAANQLRAQRKKERGGKNPKKARLGKRGKRIKRRKKRAIRKQARKWRKRVRAEQQQLNVNGVGTNIEAKTLGKPSKKSTKGKRG